MGVDEQKPEKHQGFVEPGSEPDRELSKALHDMFDRWPRSTRASESLSSGTAAWRVLWRPDRHFPSRAT